MAHVGPGDHRDREITETFGQDVLDQFRGAAAGERPGHDAGHAVQVAGTAQLGEHPVQAVLLLVDVLEQQDAAAGRPGRAGTQGGREQAQRAAHRDSAGHAGHQRHRFRVLDHGRLLRAHQRAQQRPERVVRRGLPDRGHRTEQRRPAEPDRHRLEHGRHIGVASQHLGRHPGQARPVHRLQGALRARAAAGEQDAGDARIGQRGPQVTGPHRVVTGQVGPHRAGVVRGRVGHRVKSGEAQRVQAGRQGHGIGRAADADHRAGWSPAGASLVTTAG